MTLANETALHGDEVGAQQAFERAARASSWPEHMSDATRLISAALAPTSNAREHLILLERTFALATVVGLPDVWTVGRRCGGVGALPDCDRLLATIARDGGSLMTLGLATSLSERAGLPEAATRRRQYNAILWAQERTTANDRFVDEISDAAENRSLIERLEVTARSGEVPFLRSVLQRSGLSADDAARRYASGNADSEARRTAELRNERSRPAPAP